MQSWQQQLADQANALAIGDGITESGLDVEGVISWQPRRKCPKGCLGVFSAMEIDLGNDEIFMRGNADYCPTCDEVFLKDRVAPMYMLPGYLSILQRKVQQGIADPDLTNGGSCQECKEPTKVLTKQLTVASKGTNIWIVCTNPKCSWGEHKVL